MFNNLVIKLSKSLLFRKKINYDFRLNYSTSSNLIKKEDDSIIDQNIPLTDPFSSLYVNSKYSQVIFSCLKPIFNFQKYLDKKYLDQMEYNLCCRNKDNLIKNGLEFIDLNYLKSQIVEYINIKNELNKVKNEMWKIKKQENKNFKMPDDLLKKLFKVRNKFLEKDEKLIPILLRLPNFFSDQVPIKGYEDLILNEIKPLPYNFKLYDFKKLSYMNKYRISSIIGPKADYLIGEGAFLMFALKKYFRKYIEKNFQNKNGYRNLHEIDGLDMVKSVIIEASNDYDNRNYLKNPLIIKNLEDSQKIHLVGNCSLENFICLIGKRDVLLKSLPTKFIQFGDIYNNDLKQFSSINLVVLTRNDFDQSNLEFNKIENILWDLYKTLNLPIRLRRCNVRKLAYNEYCKIELDVWFPFSCEWKKVSEFMHYSDYVSLRIGNDYTHILAGNLVNFNLLLDSLIENNQTEMGKILIPKSIKNFMNEFKDLQT